MGHIAPYMPDLDTVVSIVAVMALVMCWPLCCLAGLGILNLHCRRKLKAEGWTNEDMAELQRRMLGYAAKSPKEVERLYWWMQVWGRPRQVRVAAVAEPEPTFESPSNVVYFDDWYDRAMEAAE